jgi:hypothetical protein
MHRIVLVIALYCFCIACKNETSSQSTLAPESSTLEVDSANQSAQQDSLPNKPITYSILRQKEWIAQKDTFEGAKYWNILIAINRTDSAHLKRLDSIIVPNRYDLELADYMPFPKEVPLLKDVEKMLIFSNPVQAFAAYEHGRLVRQGQSNMGKKASPTPPKLYFCNWKSKRAISTVDKSWILYWNFNISNFGGIGFHQYALPGYPASHSCMRLQESDAYFLYHWAEQWIMKDDIELAKGTPVLVYGKYPFGEPRPWYALVQNPKALTLNEDSMRIMLEPYMEAIMNAQENRNRVKQKPADLPDL